MFDKSQVAVVIPTYRERLSKTEEISLSQALKILGEYEFYYICPESLEPNDLNGKIHIVRFQDEWFSSVRKYSALMLQKELYRKFSGYEYILVYQLDSFLFSDQLSEFCDLGYDYIGAPWLHGILHYVSNDNLLQKIGNGGVSLRKVSAFMNWLEQIDLSAYIDIENEDVLIAAYGKDWLRFSDIKVALRFSFDLDPKGSYQENDFRVPFGCHAWQRYDLEFWRPFIEREGYDLEGITASGNYERYQLRYQLEDERNQLLERVLEKSVQEIENLTNRRQRKLYIWGTGLWGGLVAQIYHELEIVIRGYIDNKNDISDFMGYPVQRGDFIERDDSHENVILIAVVQSGEIEKQLKQNGYFHKKDYITIKDMM